MTEYVKVHGLDGLLDAMKKLPREVFKNGGPAKLAMKAGAKLIADEAKSRVAVGHTDDVHVRDNIVATRDSRPRDTGVDVAERFVVRVRRVKQPGGSGTKNWGALEFGNEHQAARPFLRPAFEAKKNEALTVIVNKLRAGVERAAAKVRKL